jgi:hypothetical protein
MTGALAAPRRRPNENEDGELKMDDGNTDQSRAISIFYYPASILYPRPDGLA